LRRNIRPSFEGRPVAYVTPVPPRRIVPLDALPQMRVADEARSLRRLLDKRLPEGPVAAGIFDVRLVDDQKGGKRKRYRPPHFHVLVAGITMTEARKLCDGLYAATEKVACPVHVRDAPSPRGALAYSLKHVGDVKVRTIYDKRGDAAGQGKRKRRLNPAERVMLERRAQQQTLDEYLLLTGLRRFGSMVKQCRSGGTGKGCGCGGGGIRAHPRGLEG
jgi:hypothetical protein